MKPLALLLLLLAATPLLTATPLFAADDPRIAEGVALHDAGKYDQAITKYREVLAAEPGNGLARYELAYSLYAKGEYAECATLLQPLADLPGKAQAGVLASLGNCLDSGGHPDQAIATYRKGLAISPDDPSFLYNLAIALSGKGEWDEARELLKKNATLRPSHTSGRYALARTFEQQNFRAAALLEYLRFLTLEPATPRAKEAAGRIVALLHRGVSSTGGNNINITIDPNSPKEEGDFSGWEMMISMTGGLRFTKEQRRKSEFDKTQAELSSALTMLLETRADLGTNYTNSQNIPFFVALQEQKLLDPFTGAVLLPLNLKGGEAWAKKNAAALLKYRAWAEAWQ
jgi:tetratricopeptide (TPR) repeat protein